MADRTILVICGLNREARLAAGPGVLAVAGGADSAILRRRLAELRAENVAAVVSFGLAGALDPALRVGQIVVPGAVLDEAGQRWTADLDLSARLRNVADRLGHQSPRRVTEAAKRPSRSTDHGSTRAPIRALQGAPQHEAGWAQPGPEPLPTFLGVDAPVLDVVVKARLKAETGAVAVDMESHIAAAYAARLGVPFAALRVVSDGADRTLPPAAAIAMRPDGSIDLAGVLASLVRRPAQIPALIATARDAAVAFRQLGRVRGLLGPRFGLHL